jgi:hypothetical protein
MIGSTFLRWAIAFRCGETGLKGPPGAEIWNDI